MEVLLPVWIIGAPFVLAIISRIRTPKVKIDRASIDTMGPRSFA